MTRSDLAVPGDATNAFTCGYTVPFGPGESNPGALEGQRHPDPAAEREADEVAQRVVEGGEIGIYEMYSSDVHVQRAEKYTRRELLGGEPTAEETAEAVDETVENTADPQQLLEDVVSQATEIDWASVFKKAGLAAMETNALASAVLAAGDEVDSQVRSDDMSPDALISHLDQREPPQSWVSTIAQQAADIVGADFGGNDFDGIR